MQTLQISEEKYNTAWNSVVNLFGSGKMTAAEYSDEFKKLSGSTSDVPASMLLGWEYENKYQANSEVYKLIEDLKDQGIMVGVLSNTNPVYEAINNKFKTYDQFKNENVILSHKVGLRKPDMEIYKLTLAKLGLAPDQVVFIDDAEKNTKVTNDLGMHGIVFQNANNLRLDLRKLGIKV